jgi:hypothetical protein
MTDNFVEFAGTYSCVTKTNELLVTGHQSQPAVTAVQLVEVESILRPSWPFEFGHGGHNVFNLTVFLRCLWSSL